MVPLNLVAYNLLSETLKEEIKAKKWPAETNGLFNLGLELLSKQNKKGMTRKEELAFYATAIGTIVTGLALNQNQANHGSFARRGISNDPNNTFYQVPCYSLNWDELLQQCGIHILSQIGVRSGFSNKFYKNNPVDLHVIKISGYKVLNGELPFDSKQMTALFPPLKRIFNKIESERNIEHKQIADLFGKTILRIPSNKLQTNYLTAIGQLQTHVLSQFRAGYKAFNFDSCMALAGSTNALTDKLFDKTATAADIQSFQEAHKDLKIASSASHSLLIILATIATTAAAIVAGFFIGGPVLAVAGGCVTAGVGTAMLVLGLFTPPKSKPVAEKVALAADKLVSDRGTIDNATDADLFNPYNLFISPY
ncbi:MAG: hypothetical protein WC785_11065 [Tatlockia sp.]|jgi:hypothetical protein